MASVFQWHVIKIKKHEGREMKKTICVYRDKCMVPGMKSVLTLLMRLLCATALLLPAFGAQAGAILTPLYSFQGSYPIFPK
jgi:hypothetical protein